MLTVLSIIIPVFFVVLCGYIYASFERPDMQVINRMIMQLLCPALIFSAMSSKDFEIAIYSKIAIGAAGIVLLTGLITFVVAKIFAYEWKTVVPPMMFRNWGNLGIPLIVFAFGNESLNAAIIFFLVGNVIHFTIGLVIVTGEFKLRNFISTPIIIAMVIGLLVNLMQIEVPLAIARPIEMIGQAAIPLMLVSLGVRLQVVRWNDFSMALMASVLGPVVGILLALAMSSLLGLDSLQAKQLLIFGALPPAVMNYIFAERYKQEPEKVASIVLLGNLLSIFVYFFLLLIIL